MALYAFAAAFLLRLLWLLAIPIVPVSDSHAYDVFARNMALGHGYGWEPGKPSAYWPVGTSAIYAAFYWLFGRSYTAIGLFQVAEGVAIVVIATSLARRWFNEQAAVATAWLLACWPLLIQYTTLLASELHFILFTLAAFWLAGIPARGVLLRSLSSGAALAAAGYVRPLALLMPPLLFLREGLERAQRKSALWGMVLCAVMMAACIAPWTLRNWQTLDRFVVISTNGGGNLWMGNNPEADTGYMTPPALGIDNEADVDRVLGQRAREYIFQDPIAFLKRSLKKLIVLHDRETIGITWNEGGILQRVGRGVLAPLKFLSSAYWWTALALAIWSLYLLAREGGMRRVLLCTPVLAWGYFTVVHSVTVAADRYHVPALPFIAILAAYAISQLWRRGTSPLREPGG